jgi:hypothetical protein
MKTSVKSILFTGIVAIIATGSMFAQSSNNGFEQLYRAKFGRPSPTELARLSSQPINAASLDAKPFLTAESANSGFAQWYRAKVGRPSPAEEIRLKSSQVNPTLPEVTQPAVSADGGFEQRYQAKIGRPSPIEETRLDQIPAAAELSKDQLSVLISAAKTPSEHRRIAEFFQSQAQHYLAMLKEHQTMLAAYKSNPGLTNNKNQASTVNHCAHYVQEFNVLATKSNELAQSHERMAAEAAKM